MRRVNQAVSLVFFILSCSIMWVSWIMEYYTPLGPGPGFFPLWLSGCMAGLSLIWLYQASTDPDEPIGTDFIPSRVGMIRILSIMGALLFMWLFMEKIGFQLTMCAFLVFLLVILGQRNKVLILVISLLGSFGMYYVFNNWLGVQLPESTIEWLSARGL